MEYLIIGAGRVGTSLALGLQLCLPHFFLVCNSDKSESRAIKSGVRSGNLCRELPERIENTLVAICVPDNSIAEVADSLSCRIGNGVVIFHTSGMLGADALDCCAVAGANVCAAHPYQTFYSPKADFGVRYMWAIESSIGRVDEVERFISLSGGKFTYLTNSDSTSKSLYHASAVFCSNYMNTIISLGKTTARIAGIDPADFLPPILETTLANNIEMMGSPDSPMTGPIAREDLNAISRHIEALGTADKHLLNAYVYLTLAALEDSARTNTISNEFYSQAKHILSLALK